MPVKLRKPCAQPGCPEIVDGNQWRCAKHLAAQHRMVDRRRGSAASRGYDRHWEVERAWFLRRNRLCVICRAAGRLRPATEVDHIVPLADGGPDEPDNWQPLCHSCHSRKTAMENALGGKHET